jgi:single-strand DNA-binding protein
VANFRLAVTGRFKDGDSWRDGETSYFRINVWRQLAEHVAESLSKGDRTIVIGRLKSRSWETPEGDKRSVVEVEADEVAPSLRWAVAKPQRAPTARAGPRLQRHARSRAPASSEAGADATRPGLAHHEPLRRSSDALRSSALPAPNRSSQRTTRTVDAYQPVAETLWSPRRARFNPRS